MEEAAHVIHICGDGWNLGAMHQTEGPVTLTEMASQSAAGGLWASHSTTLSRSRPLMLSDCSLNPSSRLFTVNTRRGRDGKPLKTPFPYCFTHLAVSTCCK